jgi:imidazolonepropionase-like amidohydrolase
MQTIALPLNDVPEARAAAERLVGEGVDFLKIYNNLSPEQHQAVAAVAKAKGVPFAGHVPFKMGEDQVSAAGQSSVEHSGPVKDCIPEGGKAMPAILNAWIARGFPGKFEETNRRWAIRDEAKCKALYRRMAERGTWWVPTLALEIKGGAWTTAEDLSVLPPKLRDACRSTLASIDSAPQARDRAVRDLFERVRTMHRAGVPILAGSDVPNDCLWHGRSLHKELQLLAAAGLSNWEALRTATINPARFLGRGDEGAVRVGAAANLLLLNRNPLADIANTLSIAGVVLRGAWNDGTAFAAVRAGGPAAPDATIYENGSVWTGSGFERRALAVVEGRFVEAAAAPEGAKRVDLAGGFVVPAFANAHAHLTSANEKTSRFYLEAGVYYIWNPTTIVMDAEALAFYRRPDTFDVKVSQGGVTEPGGHPEKLYVDVLARHVYKGKTLDYFLGNAFHYGRDKAEIDQALDRLAAQKAHFVKAYLLWSEEYRERRDDPARYGYKGLNPINLSYLVAAARARGMPVAVHVETVHDLKVAALSGAAIAAHLPGYWAVKTKDELLRRTLSPADAERIARTGMMFVATYAVANEEGVGVAAAGKQDVSRRQVHEMQARNIRLLREAGGTFLIGTDGAGPIFEEVEHLVAIGAMTNLEALAATFGTGRRLFPERRIGCFEPGCEADFLVLSGDPSVDVSALRSIARRVKQGRELAF